MKFITDISEESRLYIEKNNEWVSFSRASLKYFITEAICIFWWIVLIIFSLRYVFSNRVTVYKTKEIQISNTTVIHNDNNFKLMDKVRYYGENWPINDWVLKQIVTTKDWTYYDICTWDDNSGDCLKESYNDRDGVKCKKFKWDFINCKSKSLIANSKEELLNCK